jgi:hypothetical protein
MKGFHNNIPGYRALYVEEVLSRVEGEEHG